MKTNYGLRGAIGPGKRFKTAEEAFLFDRFEVEIKDGVIAIGFNDQVDAARARDIVREHLAWFSLKHGIRYTADLNQSWEFKRANKDVGIAATGTVKVAEDVRITIATIQGEARIVSDIFDSA